MTNIRQLNTPADCILIHTDGSCLGNPGPGGWGATFRRFENGRVVKKRDASGGTRATTNNRMELTAALEALKCLRPNETAAIIIRADSQYLITGMTERAPRWASRGWRKADGKPAGNQDLWEALLVKAEPFSVEWQWVRAHAGDKRNEKAHLLAKAAARTVALRY